MTDSEKDRLDRVAAEFMGWYPAPLPHPLDWEEPTPGWRNTDGRSCSTIPRPSRDWGAFGELLMLCAEKGLIPTIYHGPHAWGADLGGEHPRAATDPRLALLLALDAYTKGGVLMSTFDEIAKRASDDAEKENPLGLEFSDFGNGLYWAYNLPLQVRKMDSGAYRILNYAARKDRCAWLEEDVPSNERGPFFRDAAKTLRNLAALMDAVADDKIETVYYPDEPVMRAIESAKREPTR